MLASGAIQLLLKILFVCRRFLCDIQELLLQTVKFELKPLPRLLSFFCCAFVRLNSPVKLQLQHLTFLCRFGCQLFMLLL